MKTKRVWLVSLCVLVILAALLGTFGFLLPSVQASQDKAAPSAEQPLSPDQAAPVENSVSVPDYKTGDLDGTCNHASADQMDQLYLDQ